LEDNNPWLENNRTSTDIDRQSSAYAEAYINNHLRGNPDGVYTNQVKRDIETLYDEKDSTILRYTVRKISAHPNTESQITDYTKPDDYFIKYKHKNNAE
jgi:hypothetical protein